MDLILWRHAEAQDALADVDDLQRPLTSRGDKQAARMAMWLDRQLPEGTRVLSSPAVRCERTAMALGRKYKVRSELGPDATVNEILEVAQWPDARQPVLVVGHQPVLGELIAQLLGFQLPSCPVRKGSVWWFRTRERDGHVQTILLTVQSPETI